MAIITREREPLLQSPQSLSRRSSLRFATFAVSALMVVCFAALTVLKERSQHPSELIPSNSDIETQPGQLGGADPYSPRRFSPYVSLSAPELLNAQEKIHEQKLNFFLKSQLDSGIISQQPGLELSESDQVQPEVSAPMWIRFPKHRAELAHKLQRLSGGRLDPIMKKAAATLDSAAMLRKDPVFREVGRFDGASVMNNRRVRSALQKIASRLVNFNERAAHENHELSQSLDKVGEHLSLRVRRDRDLIKSESVWSTPGIDDVNAAI